MAAKASPRAAADGRADTGAGPPLGRRRSSTAGVGGARRPGPHPPAVRVLVILPTYEEAENIAEVLRKLRLVVPSAEVLVVDDNSPDGTADLAEAVARELAGVAVLRRPAKAGLGTAYRFGFRWGLAEG